MTGWVTPRHQTGAGRSGSRPEPSARKTRPSGILSAVDAVFAAKAFVAAMLAYWFALRIGLIRPYWSVITAYIVAQPLAGAVLSKALFRLLGTVIGALVAIALVPNLVDAPELLSLALASWLGTCTYVSLLDRTPRSYVALLAGYTAAIIGFPAVATPDAVFEIASVRVQEITIGIAAATLVHRLILPRSVSKRVQESVRSMLEDAERWSGHALALMTGAELDLDRRRLTADLHELHQLSVHLPFDTDASAPRLQVLRALQDQLSLLLPLASAVEDRLGELVALDFYRDELAAFVADVGDWLGRRTDDDAVEAHRLVLRARRMEPDGGKLAWSDALTLSALDRLVDLIMAHLTCRRLQTLLSRRDAAAARAVRPSLERARRRPLHRDRAIAFRGAAATAVTVLAGCVFWISTAWPDGAGAVVIAAIVCALFSNMDDPAPVARQVLHGTAAAVATAALYAFAVLPRTTDLITLVMVLAPVFLAVGLLLVKRRTSAFGIGFILSFPGIVGLNEAYDSSFDTFANAAVAQLLGVLLAVVVLGLVRTIGAEHSAERLIRAGWNDLARRASGRRAPDTSAWISQMLDRVGLLTPRLVAIGHDPSEPLLDILADTRVGMAIDDLQRLRPYVSGREAAIVTSVLRSISRHFARLRIHGDGAVPPSLVRNLDVGLRRFSRSPDQALRRRAVLALTGLRRNLAPAMPGPNP